MDFFLETYTKTYLSGSLGEAILFKEEKAFILTEKEDSITSCEPKQLHRFFKYGGEIVTKNNVLEEIIKNELFELTICEEAFSITCDCLNSLLTQEMRKKAFNILIKYEEDYTDEIDIFTFIENRLLGLRIPEIINLDTNFATKLALNKKYNKWALLFLNIENNREVSQAMFDNWDSFVKNEFKNSTEAYNKKQFLINIGLFKKVKQVLPTKDKQTLKVVSTQILNDALEKIEALESNTSNLIKIIGIGDIGCTVVNQLKQKGNVNADFLICNTNILSLQNSTIVNKVYIHAGGFMVNVNPELRTEITKKSLKKALFFIGDNSKLVIIITDMNSAIGATGAPIIAKACKDKGLLTLGICTIPFKSKVFDREENLRILDKNVDALFTNFNNNLENIYYNTHINRYCVPVDNSLLLMTQQITEVLKQKGEMHINFDDFHQIIKSNGYVKISSGISVGLNRAKNAIADAFTSFLPKENDTKGPEAILVHITFGLTRLTANENKEIINYIHHKTGTQVKITTGSYKNDTLGDNLKIILIASGFEASQRGHWKNEEQIPEVLEDTRINNSESEEITLNANYQKEDSNFSSDKSDKKATIQHFDLDSNYDEAMKRISDNRDNQDNQDNQDVSNEIKENGSERLKNLSFNTRPDAASLIKQKADYLKKKAAYETKNINFKKALDSYQNETSKSSIKTTSDGEIKIGKNKFLHDGLD